MSSSADLQHSIHVVLEDSDLRDLSRFIEIGSPESLGIPPAKVLRLYCEFLLEKGKFSWEDATHAVRIISDASGNEFICAYILQATDRTRRLDDLALVGGDEGFCATVASQILDLSSEMIGRSSEVIKEFASVWEATLGLTIEIWPETYQRLLEAITDAQPSASSDRLITDDGFKEIVTEFGPLVARIAASYEGDASLREDLVQQIFLAIWQALPTWRGDAPLKKFIGRVAQNRAISFVTKQVRQAGGGVPPDDVVGLIASQEPSPEEYAIHSNEREQLIEAVRHLPSTQRDVIVLVLEGFSYNEISEILQIPHNVLALRLSRARSTLRTVLASDGFETNSK